jgi:hypothetical protein
MMNCPPHKKRIFVVTTIMMTTILVFNTTIKTCFSLALFVVPSSSSDRNRIPHRRTVSSPTTTSLRMSSSSATPLPSITSEEVRSRTLHQIQRLRERDRQSYKIKKEVRSVFRIYYCIRFGKNLLEV